MDAFKIEAQTSEGESLEGLVYDEEATVRIIGGEEESAKSGINRWFNSASLHVDPEKDEVTCVISVSDPRGGFAFTVRRNDRGEILISTPYPGEGMAHMETKQLHKGKYQGTLVVIGDSGKPLTFEDEDELDRDEEWRGGWGAMEDGDSAPTDEGAKYGISYSSKKSEWSVVDLETGKPPREDDVIGFDDPDEAAERAEELNGEAELEDDED